MSRPLQFGIKHLLYAMFLVAFVAGNLQRPIRWFFGLPTAPMHEVMHAPAPPYIEFGRGIVCPFKAFPICWNFPTAIDGRSGNAVPAINIIGNVVGVFALAIVLLFYLIGVPTAVKVLLGLEPLPKRRDLQERHD